jgi:hypothetical protein
VNTRETAGPSARGIRPGSRGVALDASGERPLEVAERPTPRVRRYDSGSSSRRRGTRVAISKFPSLDGGTTHRYGGERGTAGDSGRRSGELGHGRASPSTCNRGSPVPGVRRGPAVPHRARRRPTDRDQPPIWDTPRGELRVGGIPTGSTAGPWAPRSGLPAGPGGARTRSRGCPSSLFVGRGSTWTRSEERSSSPGADGDGALRTCPRRPSTRATRALSDGPSIRGSRPIVGRRVGGGGAVSLRSRRTVTSIRCIRSRYRERIGGYLF